ncbi:MAG TPA: hypothetical protein VF399_00425 [bacterium]
MKTIGIVFGLAACIMSLNAKEINTYKDVLGTWLCQTPDGAIALTFKSQSELVFDGEAIAYTLANGIVTVDGEYGPVDYPVALGHDTLFVTFPDGYPYPFVKDKTKTPEKQSAPGSSGVTKSPELMNNFAGTWINYTTNTETRMSFAPDGNYYEYYEASYSGDYTDGGGNDQGSWGNANASNAAGKWTANGSRSKGVITITYSDGTERRIEYSVHVENGETYWNEYWFNGALHGRQRE